MGMGKYPGYPHHGGDGPHGGDGRVFPPHPIAHRAGSQGEEHDRAEPCGIERLAPSRGESPAVGDHDAIQCRMALLSDRIGPVLVNRLLGQRPRAGSRRQPSCGPARDPLGPKNRVALVPGHRQVG